MIIDLPATVGQIYHSYMLAGDTITSVAWYIMLLSTWCACWKTHIHRELLFWSDYFVFSSRRSPAIQESRLSNWRIQSRMQIPANDCAEQLKCKRKSGWGCLHCPNECPEQLSYQVLENLYLWILTKGRGMSHVPCHLCLCLFTLLTPTTSRPTVSQLEENNSQLGKANRMELSWYFIRMLVELILLVKLSQWVKW